ncbi:PXA domain-domain-containing protein [Coniella lustricola]|uniref:PXA domain-domain-containing protein n=1 Tax=Coniella lustricola TaxID=2025994 RepID=A0A2T3A160_9PEZI|nr:PXA domain-domain-containing protein [Coniella lustricola]
MTAQDATHPTSPAADIMASSADLDIANHSSSSSPSSPLLPPTSDGGLSQQPSSIESPVSSVPAHVNTTAQSQPPSANDDVTTKLFQFLSTATPNTLAAVAVGLSASTYLILGQLGLLVIGAFGGIAAYIHWEASNPDFKKAVYGETGLDLATRLLGQRSATERIDENKDATNEDGEDFLAHSFADFQPETREALNGFVDAVVRDYVKWWYGPILPSDRSFPLSCRKVLSSFLVSIANHLGRKRPADSFLDFLTNSSSMVIVFFSELSSAFSVLPPDSKMTAIDAVYDYLSSNPDSKLSHLLSQRHQSSKFRSVAEDLLGFLDRQTYDCDPARTFLREILAGVILEMSLQSCSKAEWINGWIVYLLEAGEPDFNQAIDVGMQTGPDANGPVFADIDGNVGNIGLAKATRTSSEVDRARRRDSGQAHKKKLSKADEEMENAMEEMKRMNQMILEERKRNSSDSKATKSSVELDSPQTPADLPARTEAHAAGTKLEVESLSTSATASAGAPPLTDNPWSEEPSTTEPLIASSPSQATQSPAPNSTSRHSHQTSFTNFEQLVPPAQDDSDGSDGDQKKPVPLTLHNAKITIYDDGINEKSRIRSKPSWDYLIQIEPSSSYYSGWMIPRQYTDFEKLHEVIRRIATVSGITAFTEQHSELPNFKIHTRESLRGELERYVRDACWYKALAESEGMKRFLDKDQGHNRQQSKSGFQAVESFGKNVFGVLASAPKGVAEGGKVITGVFGNMGLTRKTTASSLSDTNGTPKRLSTPVPPSIDSTPSFNGPRKTRDSMDSQRSSVISVQPGKTPPMDRRSSLQIPGDLDTERAEQWERPIPSPRGSRANSRASSLAALRSPLRSPSTLSLEALKLPPPPDSMPDDWGMPGSPEMTRSSENLAQRTAAVENGAQTKSANDAAFPTAKRKKQYAQISEQETRVAVELVFAMINELYTLSSAWNFRRTLLAAAKSFLLRPGNPSLLSIQKMLQESLIEANSSDAGIAAHLRKLRENTLPTEEERKAWPSELTMEEKEKLREKARSLLIQCGVPVALSGVMGQGATNEALGRIFDCLQIEEVARGLIFGLMLQAVRVLTD